MQSNLRAAGFLMQGLLQRLAFGLLLALGLGLTVYSAAAALGYVPWLTMQVQFGEFIIPDAGVYVQLALAALAIALVGFLPANARVMALENSHRNFQIGMKDVARAYAVAHASDREGVFNLASEYDSIRARMAFLRDHPDLADLEPSVLELASQMSHISRELANVYSDSNVQRARDFLTARQQEIEDFNERLDEAKNIAVEMRRWHERVELEESVAESQLARLCEALEEILPEVLPESERTDLTEADIVVPGSAEWGDDSDAPAWDDDGSDETGEDARIVALLSRRAAE